MWSPDPSTLQGESLVNYAALCGHVLARAHARSGDAVAINAYLGKSDAFDAAIEDFSREYVDTVDRDFAAFQQAVASGRLAGGPADQEFATYLSALRSGRETL